jgi:hypothetical protein
MVVLGMKRKQRAAILKITYECLGELLRLKKGRRIDRVYEDPDPRRQDNCFYVRVQGIGRELNEGDTLVVFEYVDWRQDLK